MLLQAANALANGSAEKTSNGSLKNGSANGTTTTPTTASKPRAADYYINGDLASDVHYRHTNGKANGTA